MRIEKDNIFIRSAAIEDARILMDWWNDGRIMEHAGFPNGLAKTLDDIEDEIRTWEGKLSQLCIIEIDNRPVGELSYRIKAGGSASAGWKICDTSYQNQGYGTEIIKILFEFLFTDKEINSKEPLDIISWDTLVENKRAQHVYEFKLGARRLGLRERAFKDQLGNWRSAVDYEITREGFLNAR